MILVYNEFDIHTLEVTRYVKTPQHWSIYLHMMHYYGEVQQ